MENKLISLREAARQSGFDQNYLRVLINRGVLRASKVGRDWFVTEVELNQYIKKRSRFKARRALKGVNDLSSKTSINNNTGRIQTELLIKPASSRPTENLLVRPNENFLYFFNIDGSKEIERDYKKRYENSKKLDKRRYVSLKNTLNKPNLTRHIVSISLAVLLLASGVLYAGGLSEISHKLVRNLPIPSANLFSDIFLGSGLRESVSPPSGNLEFGSLGREDEEKTNEKNGTTIVREARNNTKETVEKVVQYIPANTSSLREELLQMIQVEQNKIRAEIAAFGDDLFSVKGSLNNTSRVANSSIQMVSVSQRIDKLSALTVSDSLTISSGNLLVSNGNVTAQSANFVNLTVTGTCTGCGGSGLQTPWTSNINGGGFALTNAGTLPFTDFSATSTSAPSSISTGGLTIGTDQFVVQQTSGRIGIGTSSPAQLLSVVGSSYITGGVGIGIATTSSGVIQTSGVINIGGAGTSTFSNGVNLSTGCFAISG